MSNTRRSYSRDFKISAVKKMIEHGLSNAEVGRDLGINDGMLRYYIERFFNPVRLHSAIGYVSPNDYEQHKLFEKKGPGNLPSSESFVGRSPERRPQG